MKQKKVEMKEKIEDVASTVKLIRIPNEQNPKQQVLNQTRNRNLEMKEPELRGPQGLSLLMSIRAYLSRVITEMIDGGVDRSVECTGNIDAMISTFECVHDGWGIAVLVGVPHKDAVFKTHPMNLLNERTLKGSFFGNYKPRSDLSSVVEKYKNKELELGRFITHKVPFVEINKAFDYMLKREGLRCIIRMD
ncbi:hypothetical protein RJ639_037169 [Escallonia herrerae]|uniref:alcohol dehydrogenase n=1 Tax=Escallonia herrerae TaxID=1293975 RepID=A0AA88WRA3_9ASTE|nr:hypothetical protein RJ639_037169 [Escallonia herrerae]